MNRQKRGIDGSGVGKGLSGGGGGGGYFKIHMECKCAKLASVKKQMMR